jgi:hypothetical protein
MNKMRLGVLATLSAVLLAGMAWADFPNTLALDVACNGTTFQFVGPTTGGGPAKGDTFVVKGYIYPAGFFKKYGATSGVNPDGSPQFPNLVIGTWYCRGWFLQDFASAKTGPFVATTQIYDLSSEGYSRKALTSDGLELVDQNVKISRAIVGGTGPYAGAKGEVEQTAISTNATGLFNFTYAFNLLDAR